MYTVVGIGASAGGLESFTQLLSQLPADTGMAFVLIQHLAPDHRSLLTELMARQTLMPVCEITDGMPIAPNQVYIIPPNKKMVLDQGVFKLSPRANTKGRHLPIDTFFQSLATECGRDAIAIILSGADSDGTLGLEAIKTKGGITFAQDMASSQFEQMPESAIAAGYVDFILPVADIAEELIKISRRNLQESLSAFVSREIKNRDAEAKIIEDRCPVPTSPEVIELSDPSDLNQIFNQIFKILWKETKVDFSNYKSSTLLRRTDRRMSLLGLSALQEYVNYLLDHPAEVNELFQNLLIDVTSFFRDPEVFEALKTQVFPRMMSERSPDLPIRIWVAGCSSGEEVYSIAISLIEFLENLLINPSIQIFATDINESAIASARAGIYRLDMVGVSPERIRRFFVRVQHGFQIAKSVRELCIFAKHNLISDPPFSNLDLISCRNVLIYFGKAIQKRAMQSFHYGINPNGCLLLGTSETTHGFSDLFTTLDKDCKIYAKKLIATKLNFDFIDTRYTLAMPRSARYMPDNAAHESDIQKIADQIAINRYAPVGVVINTDLEVLQFRGDTSPYLRLASGKPSFNLLKIVRPDLALELRAAIRQAIKQNIPIEKYGIKLQDAEIMRAIAVSVIPFQTISELRYYLVVFQPEHTWGSYRLKPAALPPQVAASTNTRSTKIKLLEQENAKLRQELVDCQRKFDG